jgi:hypothetical protein
MPFKSGKNIGYTKTEIRGIIKFLDDICREFGEYSVVIRTATGEEIQIPYIRRELEMEGSINKAVQGVKEEPKTVYSTFDFNRYTVATGLSGSLESGGDTRSWIPLGDIPYTFSVDLSGSGTEEQTHGGSVQLGDETKRREGNQGEDQ